MPSFKFRGFTAGSVVALTVAQGAISAQASVTWGQAGGGGQPNASFSISRTDGIAPADTVAPFSAWFRAVNLSGFDVSEPAGPNVYDPTQHRITFIWDFDDPGYEPLITPNIPTAWRNTNIGYGKEVCHVFDRGGSYSVTCFAFDESGNWGMATYAFGAGGDAPAIPEADAFFAGNRTIVFSAAGDFAGKPAGATECTTVNAVNSALNARAGAGDTLCRVLLRRGETYTFTGLIGRGTANWGLHLGAYGTGPEPRVVRTTSGPFEMRDNTRHCVVSNIVFEGNWDATTETGLQLNPYGDLANYHASCLFHRCRFSGFNDLAIALADSNYKRVFSDSEVTNWQNYGVYCEVGKLAIVGCDFHQHEDALSGVDQGTANSNNIDLGNRHGAVRVAASDDLYFACSSFFSRNGWSTASERDGYVSKTPTAGQPGLRLAHAARTGSLSHRMFERCSHEAVGDHTRFQSFGNTVDAPKNNVLDKNLFVATSASEGWVNSNHPGMTIRNGYFFRPNVPNRVGTAFYALNLGAAGTPSGTANVNQRIYNNTFLQLGPVGAANPINVSASYNQTIENNVIAAPDFSPPLTAFAPLGTAPLEGFVARYKGARWNFPPIGGPNSPTGLIVVTAVREGGAGPVANGEWVAIPWPNYGGLCNGAGPADLRAAVLANSTQKHVVSVDTGNLTNMGDAAIWPQANGRVTFDFGNPTHLRIRNMSGSSWSSGNIFVLLDLSDRLMDFVPGTGQAGLTLPVPVPGPGSAARVAAGQGLWARDDFFGRLRTSGAVMGAFDVQA